MDVDSVPSSADPESASAAGRLRSVLWAGELCGGAQRPDRLRAAASDSDAVQKSDRVSSQRLDDRAQSRGVRMARSADLVRRVCIADRTADHVAARFLVSANAL